jgi:hypothetical protein
MTTSCSNNGSNNNANSVTSAEDGQTSGPVNDGPVNIGPVGSRSTETADTVDEAILTENNSVSQEQQDGNNNEANDSNNNVGMATAQLGPSPTSVQLANSAVNTVLTSSSATATSTVAITPTEMTLSVHRPPALPPRPQNLMLPHAGAVSRGPPQVPYTIMPPGRPRICF